MEAPGRAQGASRPVPALPLPNPRQGYAADAVRGAQDSLERLGHMPTLPRRVCPQRHLPGGLPAMGAGLDRALRLLPNHTGAPRRDGGGGTEAERRLPLWTGTATAHRHQRDCNVNDAKSAYAAFITTNAARRKGGITAEEAGVIFRDAFMQAGDNGEKDSQKRGRKRRAPEHNTTGDGGRGGTDQAPPGCPTRAQKKLRTNPKDSSGLTAAPY